MNTSGLRLVLTNLWIQLLTLPEKLNPAALIVPGAPARSNVAIMVKFFCVGMLLLLGITSSGTVLFAVSTDAECSVELVSGLLCCVAGIVLVGFLLKKRNGRIRPLWLPGGPPGPSQEAWQSRPPIRYPDLSFTVGLAVYIASSSPS